MLHPIRAPLHDRDRFTGTVEQIEVVDLRYGSDTIGIDVDEPRASGEVRVMAGEDEGRARDRAADPQGRA